LFDYPMIETTSARWSGSLVAAAAALTSIVSTRLGTLA
jgi:hypothetical protein